MKNLIKKCIFCFILAVFPLVSLAHVSYVLTPDELAHAGGENAHFLAEAFQNPGNIALMVGTAAVVVALIVLSTRITPIRKFFERLVQRLQSYHELIPWVLRLALGIALIGAGTSHVFLSPSMPLGDAFSFIQILLGFCFLAGFLLAPAAIITIGLYIYGVATNAYLVGNADLLVMACSVLVFHSARPGVDDLLGISLLQYFKIPRKYLAPIIRIGLGAAFVFLALYEKILNPGFSDLVVTKYHLMSIIPVSAAMWVVSAGIIELALGILILLGYYTRVVAFVAILVLSLTFFYFREAVYSHVTLFSALAILAIEGGGLGSFDVEFGNKVKP